MKRGAIFQQIDCAGERAAGRGGGGDCGLSAAGANRAWGTPMPQGKMFPEGALPGPLVYVCHAGIYAARWGCGCAGATSHGTTGRQSQRVVMINAAAARVYWPAKMRWAGC